MLSQALGTASTEATLASTGTAPAMGSKSTSKGAAAFAAGVNHVKFRQKNRESGHLLITI